MSKNKLMSTLMLTLAALFIATSSFAQTTFAKGKLYHVYASGDKENVVTEVKDNAVSLTDYEKGNTAQFWKISELSGSWRIINPLTNKALRVNGSQVELGENNGSDEAQLWKYENGLLIPTNSPNVAVAKSKGKLVLISKEKAETHKAAKFRIEESVYAGFDDDLTYHIKWAKNPQIILGNKDTGDNGGAFQKWRIFLRRRICRPAVFDGSMRFQKW